MAHAGSLHTGCTMAHCAGTYKGESYMKDFTKENEETAQPPEPQGVEAPEPEFLEDE